MIFTFYGESKDRKRKWKAEADTAEDLFQRLADLGLIDTLKSNPLSDALLKKYGLTWQDFMGPGGYGMESFYRWSDRHKLSDEEILEIIGKERDVAYYQEIVVDRKEPYV